jgi:tetratricopeptide (TPR) repeat protein
MHFAKRVVFVGVVLLATVCFAQPSSPDYLIQGIAKHRSGDLDGAIADYTRAIALDSQDVRDSCASARDKEDSGDFEGAKSCYSQALQSESRLSMVYFNRGIAKREKRDWDGAIADDDQAIVFHPNQPIAFCNRGDSKRMKGDIDGAIADGDQAVALDPKYVDGYFTRGLIRVCKGDWDGAIADDDRVIALNPKHAGAYDQRGMCRQDKGDLAGAIRDYQTCLSLNPTSRDYPHFYLWLAQIQLDPKSDATAILSTYLSTRPPTRAGDWQSKIGDFLIGKINETDFLAAAHSEDPRIDRENHCEAWFYAGMKRLIAGDKPAAADAFRKCVATDEKPFSEWQSSQAELTALGSSRAAVDSAK